MSDDLADDSEEIVNAVSDPSTGGCDSSWRDEDACAEYGESKSNGYARNFVGLAGAAVGLCKDVDDQRTEHGEENAEHPTPAPTHGTVLCSFSWRAEAGSASGLAIQ